MKYNHRSWLVYKIVIFCWISNFFWWTNAPNAGQFKNKCICREYSLPSLFNEFIHQGKFIFSVQNLTFLLPVMIYPTVFQAKKIMTLEAVCRIQNVLLRIRIPLFKLMRIRIQKLFCYRESKKMFYQIFNFFYSIILQNRHV